MTNPPAKTLGSRVWTLPGLGLQGLKGVAASRRLAWLDLLRAMAVLLVLWGHLVGAFLAARKASWAPNDAANQYIFEPLAIRQYGGFLGVCIFFMISGYIIARVLGKESPVQFAVRRILRIFPLLFVVAASVRLLGFFGMPGMPADAYRVPLSEVLANGLLINYVMHPQVVLVGPAWSLVVEVCFYIVALALLPFLRGKRLPPVMLPISMLVVAFVSAFWSRSLGPSFFLLSVSLAYLPILAVGSVFFLYESRSIPLAVASLLAGASWLTFLFATGNIYPKFMEISIDSYPISVMAAFAIFAICFLKRESFQQLPWLISWIALASYSIYLWHGVVALPLEGVLFPALGFSLALLISLAALVVVVCFSYAWIEKPFQLLAKRLV